MVYNESVQERGWRYIEDPPNSHYGWGLTHSADTAIYVPTSENTGNWTKSDPNMTIDADAATVATGACANELAVEDNIWYQGHVQNSQTLHEGQIGPAPDGSEEDRQAEPADGDPTLYPPEGIFDPLVGGGLLPPSVWPTGPFGTHENPLDDPTYLPPRHNPPIVPPLSSILNGSGENSVNPPSFDFDGMVDAFEEGANDALSWDFQFGDGIDFELSGSFEGTLDLGQYGEINVGAGATAGGSLAGTGSTSGGPDISFGSNPGWNPSASGSFTLDGTGYAGGSIGLS